MDYGQFHGQVHGLGWAERHFDHVAFFPAFLTPLYFIYIIINVTMNLM